MLCESSVEKHLSTKCVYIHFTVKTCTVSLPNVFDGGFNKIPLNNHRINIKRVVLNFNILLLSFKRLNILPKEIKVIKVCHPLNLRKKNQIKNFITKILFFIGIKINIEKMLLQHKKSSKNATNSFIFELCGV